MRTRAVWTLMAVLAAVVSTGPAFAADEDPHITDRCGDATLYAEAGGQQVSSPDPYSPSFDIETVAFTDIRDPEEPDEVLGVDIDFTLCGAAKVPGTGEAYRIEWTLDEDCFGQVSFGERTEVYFLPPPGFEQEPVVNVGKQCRTGTTADLITNYEFAWLATFGLEAVSVDGNHLVFHLRVESLPDEAAAMFAPGTAWADPYASASGGVYGTTNVTINPGHGVFVQAATVWDQARGRTFVVGDTNEAT